jgi:hypothetical protein
MPFTPKFVDLVRNFTTVQGTGPVTLGAAISGYAGIAEALSTGDQFYYCIQGVDKPQEREVGRGTLQANGTIARQAVSGGLTSFTSGTKTIALVAAAEWFSKLELGGAGGSIDVASVTALAARTVPSTAPALLAQAGREGLFLFVAGNRSADVAADPRQGVYVAPQSDPSGASGAWVRQVNGGHNVKWFGAAGDGVTDDTAAFKAAIDCLDRNQAGNSGAARLYIPKGTYKLTDTLNIRATMIIEGDGPLTTTLEWAAGKTGIIVQRVNTADGLSGDVPVWSVGGGDGSTIRMLGIKGGFAGTEGEFHGIALRARANLADLQISNWQGDGIYSVAAAGGGEVEGNVNCAQVSRVTSLNNRCGLFVDGADTNAWLVQGCDFRNNRTWGVWDSSFLGNSYVGCHVAGNGWDGAATSIPTGCTVNGNRYYVRAGQAAGASTNAPTGTTADNSWWGYQGAGGTYWGVVAWASGTTFREGGAYKTDNPNAANLFVGCYSEGDSNPSQMIDPSKVLGGLHGAGLIGVVPYSNTGSFPLVESGWKTGANDGYLYVNNTGSFGALTFRSWAAGAPTEHGAVLNTNGWQRYTARAGRHEFFGTGGTHLGEVNDAGLSLDAGKVLSINGNQVVDARGAAVADATDAAGAITQLNALLARLRSHGLIAS